MKGEQRQELSLREMIHKVLRAWRSIVITTLVVALLLAGLKFTIDMKNYAHASANKQTATEQPAEPNLTDEQLLSVQMAGEYRETIRQKEEYLNNSLYFAIDPYNEHLVTLVYFIDATNYIDFADGTITGDGGELARAYVTCINNHLFEEFDGKENQIYYQEVVQASCAENSTYQFTVSIKGASKKQVLALTEDIKPMVTALEDKLLYTMEYHSLSLLDESYSVVIDRELLDKKTQFNRNLNTDKKSLNSLVNGFNTAQMEVYESSSSPAEEEQVIVPQKPAVSVKYFILGAVLGLFISAGFVALSYMMGSRLRKQEELTDIYELAPLGTLSAVKKKRILAFVDRLIDKCFTRGSWTAEQRTAFTVSNLKIICQKNQISTLSVITDLSLSSEEKALIDDIAEQLKSHGIALFLGEQIHKNLEAYEQVRTCGYAVLLEKEGVSFYPDIERQLTVCQQADIKVLGSVVFVQQS